MVDIPVNPYRKIRRQFRISTRGLSISSATVSRIEAGHYEELSDEMVGTLFLAITSAGADIDLIAADLEDTYGTPYLSYAYMKWRKLKRRTEGDTVQWPHLAAVRTRKLMGESPMGAFARLTSGSVPKFCSQFCVQAPTLARYIEGHFDYIEPPASVREALEDAGYSELEELFTLQRKWIDGNR